MTTPIWQGNSADETDHHIAEFLAGDDVRLDRKLFQFDVIASAAHVRGLERIGVLSPNESETLCRLLQELQSEFESGSFKLDSRFEDGHSAIEYYLTQHAVDAGKKVHTGRSRNDQVLVASRLYLKDSLGRLIDQVRNIGLACLQCAGAHQDVPMPGYTHLQRAVPSSIGMWMCGFAEGFADTLMFAKGVLQTIDCNPLGTAAGFGVNLPLDREGVSSELGFSRTQLNPIATQNSRGKFEIMALQAASHALHDVQRLAWDLSLFTTTEFGFVELPQQYITGSSIMPNKNNPDVVELLRARPAMVDACIQEIVSVVSLPSGYHRDLQFTKAPLIRGMKGALQALAIVPGLVDSIQFNEEKMAKAISPEMHATDVAIQSAVDGEPFRDAYRRIKSQVDSLGLLTPSDSLKKRVSPGACGDLRMDEIRCRLTSEK